MPDLHSLQVFQALNRSPHARLEACAELGDGLSAALWSNHHHSQDYQAPGPHTFSC
ncbi:AraC family transcriptional regulator, partial [Helicobacter pullorum NCTC 12824]